MSQASGGRPKVIGIENRFFQFDADHHSAGRDRLVDALVGEVARARREPAALAAGRRPPVVGGSDGWSQQMPVDRDDLDRAGHLVAAAERLVLDVAAHLELHRPGAVGVGEGRDLGGGKAAPTAASGGMCVASQAA